MFVNQMILEDLYKDSGEKRKEKAIKYQKEKRIKIKNMEYVNDKNFEISAEVYGQSTYKTYINIKNGIVEDVTCTCEDYYNHYGICKHTLATVLELNNNPQYIVQDVEKNLQIEQIKEKMDAILEKPKEQTYRNFKQIVNIFYQEEMESISE